MLEGFLQIAQIVPVTEAEGPGRHFALWFQGCPLRCPGCCNPEMLPFEGGQSIPVDDVIAHVEESARLHGIEGITLLGGEPLAHAAGAVLLAQAVRARPDGHGFQRLHSGRGAPTARPGGSPAARADRHSRRWTVFARAAGVTPSVDRLSESADPLSQRPLPRRRSALVDAEYSGDPTARPGADGQRFPSEVGRGIVEKASPLARRASLACAAG